MPPRSPLSSVSLLRSLVGGARGGGNRDRAKRSREIGSVEPGPRPAPVLGRKLEDSRARPARKDAKEVTEVLLGVETVKLRGGNERKPRARDQRVRLGAEEKPVVPTERDVPDLKLGEVVRDRHVTVVEKPTKRGPVVRRVLEGPAQRTAVVDRRVGKRSRAPRGEVVEHDRAVLDPSVSSFGRTHVLEVALQAKELVGEPKSDKRTFIGRGGVEEAPARMCPASARPSLGKENDNVGVRNLS